MHTVYSDSDMYPEVGLGDASKTVVTILFFKLIDFVNYHNIYLTIMIMLNLQF